MKKFFIVLSALSILTFGCGKNEETTGNGRVASDSLTGTWVSACEVPSANSTTTTSTNSSVTFSADAVMSVTDYTYADTQCAGAVTGTKTGTIYYTVTGTSTTENGEEIVSTQWTNFPQSEAAPYTIDAATADFTIYSADEISMKFTSITMTDKKTKAITTFDKEIATLKPTVMNRKK